MADQAQDKTEQATPERLLKAREEGRIPTSEEVPSAIIIIMLLVVLVLMAPSLLRYFQTEVQQGLSLRSFSFDRDGFAALMHSKIISMLLATAPLLVAIVMASVLASVISGGWTFSTKAIKIDWSRISFFSGFKNLVSLKSLVHLVVSMAKLAVIGWIVWSYLRDRMVELSTLHWAPAGGLLTVMGQLSMGVAGRIAVGLTAIAAADLLYQRWNYKRQLRMSRQEVKDERKQYELPVEIKSRQRAVQMARAKRRMLKSVPTATVVIVNPTHVAVALRYDQATMDAPVVVAKGADFLCQTIKDIAARHNVPIVERPELARALYASAAEGQPIDEALFVAVAEVLAMIFRLRKKKQT